MEIIIVTCLLIVILLLVSDKVIIKKVSNRKSPPSVNQTELPDIIGSPRPVIRPVLPNKATKSQVKESENTPDNFEVETREADFSEEIPQEEELDEVSREEPDFEEEEEEWEEYRQPNGDDGFATGVSFDELSSVGMLLQQEKLEPALQQTAVDIARRLQGTELFSLLENSIEGASRKIAELLDRSLSGADFSSSDLRKNDLEGFDIGEFV